MNLNFSDFQAVDTTNKREGVSVKRGQDYNFRFRKALAKAGTEEEKVDSFFQVSDVLFDELGLADKAGRQLISPDGKTFLAIVDDEQGTFWKASKSNGEANAKGKKFKSTVIEKALHEAGIIDSNLIGKTQKLELTVVAENVTVGKGEKAFVAYKVLEVTPAVAVEGEDLDNDTDEVSSDNQATATQEAPAQEVENSDDF